MTQEKVFMKGVKFAVLPSALFGMLCHLIAPEWWSFTIAYSVFYIGITFVAAIYSSMKYGDEA